MAKRSGEAGRPEVIRLPFPVRGTDQGWALNDQPPLTTPNLLNVRSLDWRNRQGGGKRNGHIKAITAQAGTAGAVRIRHLIPYAQPAGSATGDASVIVAVDDDFSTYSVAVPTDLGDNWVYCFHTGSTLTGVGDARTSVGTNSNGLQMNSVSTEICRLVAARFPTTNDVTATLRCRPDANTTNNNHGGADDCQTFGPFIRGSGRLHDLIACRLVRNSADTSVVIRIERWIDETPTTLGQSAGITISGGATIVEDATLRLYESGSDVIAVLNWPSQSISNATLTVSTTQNAGFNRAGVGIFAGEAGGLTSVTAFRTFARVQLTMIQPATGIVLHTISRLNAGTNRYYIPGGFTSVVNESAGVQTVVPGVYDSNTIPTGAASNSAAIDTNTSQMRAFANVGGTPRTGAFFRTSETDGPYFVEFQVSSNNTSLAQSVSFMLRANATWDTAISLAINMGTGDANQGTTEINNIANIVFRTVTGSALGSATTNQQAIPFRAGASWIRVEDDGETINVYVDGNLWISYSDATLPDDTRMGAAPFSTTAAGVCGVESIRFISRSGFVDVTENEPIVAVYTAGRVDIADIDADTLSLTTGSGLGGVLPSGFTFNGKFYAVDGTDAVITDPSTLSNASWANLVVSGGFGSFPTGCRLAALWRGRAVLARTSTQPSNWFMSRVAFPLDFDYLNSNANGGTSTAANFGTNADVGQPGDIITALIPFSDDYLIFGCANSIWMLEGDPSYGGAVQNLTYRSGIVGPRAWAFDDEGNLYFVGQSGLYIIRRGTKDPVNVTGRRLINLLDALPLDQTLVQLGWDAAGGYLNVYLTPTDGATVGTHCIYDPQSAQGGALWLDRYPVDFGPWSVAEIVGSSDDDRRLLIGGSDGYIRRPSDSAFTDDGTAIDSWVEIGPFQLGGGSVYSMAQEIQAMLGAGSAPVTWYWFTADSPEEVAALDFGSEVASGTWSNPGSTNGFQTPVGLRQTGGAHKIRIRQNTNTSTDTWSLEQIRAVIMPTGRRRI